MKDLAREIRGELIQRPKGMSLLQATLAELFGSYDKSVKALGPFEIEVADYYRQVRNGFAHTGAEGGVRRNVDALRKLVEQQGDSFSRLAAPNLYPGIEFDDFILFTRVVKQLALKFSRQLDQPTKRSWIWC